MSLPAPYRPVAVSDVMVALPADVIDLMPAEAEIPEEFGYWNSGWNEIARSWFSKGLPAEVEFYMADGLDGETAVRHLHCVLGSYQPSHEHKLAAVAFLLSQWCTKVENWKQPTSTADERA